MADIIRTDSSNPDPAAVNQRPILLARLPHVARLAQGDGGTAVATLPHQEKTSPAPESIPQLDLHTEIARQTRLHIAETIGDEAIPNTSHYADSRHATQGFKRVVKVESADESSSADIAESTTPSEKLFQLHAQLSPHAGLIVALALIASAGLLYWLLLGPVPSPLPNYHDYGAGFSAEGLGSIPEYVPEFVAEAPQAVAATNPEESANSDDQWEQLMLPTPPQQQEESIEEESEVEQLPVEPTSLPGLPASDNSPFPKTAHPESLDFSRLQPRPMNVAAPVSPNSNSEVAGRPNTTTTH